MSEKTCYAISVLTRDNVGIIAGVSSAIFEIGGNIVATSQTTSRGWFTMITHVEFETPIDEETVRDAILAAGELKVLVTRSPEEKPSQPLGDPFVATVVGDDKPGIIRGLTSCFAAKGVNVSDVWNEVCEGRFVVIIHIEVPQDIDPAELRYSLEQIGKDLGVSVMLQHQDIFTATNSLAVYTRR